MTYTLWSNGRLLGESELNYARVFPMHRMGDFRPTELGERLMPIITAVRGAALDLAKATSRASRTHSAGAQSGTPRIGEKIRQTVEYADLASAVDHHDALDLELHAPAGLVIPTEWIEVCDTGFSPFGKCESPNPDSASAVSEKRLDPTVIAGFDDVDLEGTGENDDSTEVDWPESGFEVATVEEGTLPRYQIQVMLSPE